MADTSEWIEHDGGSCPVSDTTLVVVKFGDGTVERNPVTARFWRGAGIDWWEHEANDPEFNIVAYRVVQP